MSRQSQVVGRPSQRQSKRGTKLKRKSNDPSKRRAGIVEVVQEGKDPSEMDEIDLIIARREKKYAIEVPAPSKCEIHNRLKKCYLAENDMFHLFHEMKGTRYGPPCRPELTLLQIYDRSFAPPKEIEIIFEPVKCLFVLSPRMEDCLITAVINDPTNATLLRHGYSRCGESETDYVDMEMQKIWRRFLALHIRPLAVDSKRVALMRSRAEQFARLVSEEKSNTVSGTLSEADKKRNIAVNAVKEIREKMKQSDQNEVDATQTKLVELGAVTEGPPDEISDNED